MRNTDCVLQINRILIRNLSYITLNIRSERKIYTDNVISIYWSIYRLHIYIYMYIYIMIRLDGVDVDFFLTLKAFRFRSSLCTDPAYGINFFFLFFKIWFAMLYWFIIFKKYVYFCRFFFFLWNLFRGYQFVQYFLFANCIICFFPHNQILE